MRFLFVPVSGALGLGPVSRCLALAKTAVMRGHQVFVLAPSGYPMVSGATFCRHIVSEATPRRPEGLTPAEMAGEASCMSHALAIRGMAEPSYVRTAVAEEIRTIRTVEPDVVVTEFQATAAVAALATGVPHVAMAATPYLNLYSHRDDVVRYMATVDSTYLAEAESVGVKADSIEDIVHRKCLLNVVPSIPELEPVIGGVLPQVGYFGPVLYDGLELDSDTTSQPNELRKILVYLGTGEVRLESALPILAQAFGDQEFRILAVSRFENILGRRVPFDMGNIRVAGRVGVLKELRDTEIFVNRAGQNSVMAGLLAGVPSIAVPASSPEPVYNSSVLESHRAAVVIRQDLSVEAVVDAADRLKSIRAARNSQVLGDMLRRYEGPVGAIRRIESEV